MGRRPSPPVPFSQSLGEGAILWVFGSDYLGHSRSKRSLLNVSDAALSQGGSVS